MRRFTSCVFTAERPVTHRIQNIGDRLFRLVAVINETGGDLVKFDLNEQGKWAFFDTGDPHEIRNTGDARVEFVEVEVRRPTP